METSLAALHSQSPEIIADNCKISSLARSLYKYMYWAREGIVDIFYYIYNLLRPDSPLVEQQSIGVYEEVVGDSITGWW